MNEPETEPFDIVQDGEVTGPPVTVQEESDGLKPVPVKDTVSPDVPS